MPQSLSSINIYLRKSAVTLRVHLLEVTGKISTRIFCAFQFFYFMLTCWWSGVRAVNGTQWQRLCQDLCPAFYVSFVSCSFKRPIMTDHHSSCNKLNWFRFGLCTSVMRQKRRVSDMRSVWLAESDSKLRYINYEQFMLSSISLHSSLGLSQTLLWNSKPRC